MTHLRNLTATAVLAVLLLTAPTRAAEADKYLPDNTTFVVTINVKPLLESPLGKKFLLPLFEQTLKDNAEAAQAFTALGFDPLKDFDSVVVASPGIGSTEAEKEAVKLTVILHGAFDLARIQSTAEAVMKQKPDQLKMTREGSVAIYEFKNDTQTAHLAFLDQTTAVLSGTRANVVTAIKSGGKGPKLGKEMTALLGKVDAKQTVWMAMVAPPELKKALAGQPQTSEIANKITSFSGGVTIDKDVAAHLAVHTADAKAAQSIAESLEAVKGLAKITVVTNEDVIKQVGKDTAKMIGDVIEGIQVGAKKTDATVDLKVSEETILKVIAPVQPKK